MKILYIHQYFKTPDEGGSIRSYHLAKALIDKGVEVEMITTWNQKHYEKQNIEGISVHYLPVFYENASGFFSRIRAFFSFVIKVCLLAGKIKNITCCYATSTPLTIGLIALYLKWIKKIPYYFEVRDLWPLAPIELGYIRNKLLQRFLYFFEETIYTHAEKIIALSPGIADWIEKYKTEKPVFLIPNFADCEFFEMSNQELAISNWQSVISKKQNSTDNEQFNNLIIQQSTHHSPFTITYAGTLGEANHLEYLLDVAAFFQEKQVENVHFLIVGKGKEEKCLKKKATEKGLKNLIFLGHIGKNEIREILYFSQAVYISFSHKKVLETTSPNKFFDGLAAGKLIIINTKGWLKDLVEKNNCGFYADPEKPEDFYRKMKPFLEDENLLRQAQKNARLLAETQFDKKIISEKFVKLF